MTDVTNGAGAPPEATLSPAAQQRQENHAAAERARKKLDAGQGIERLTTDELMSFLPKMAKDIPPLHELTPLQLACLTQHTLNNCSNKQGRSDYDSALQYKHAPELVRRLLEQDNEETPLRRMQMAWSLFRMGAATLDEIMPLMDRADEDATRARHVPATGPAAGLQGKWLGDSPTTQNRQRRRPARIPRGVAGVGGEFVADGICYRVIGGAVDRPTTVMVNELLDDGQKIEGAWFMVEIAD